MNVSNTVITLTRVTFSDGTEFNTHMTPLAVETLHRALRQLYRAELPDASPRVLAIKAARAALGVGIREAKLFCEEEV